MLRLSGLPLRFSVRFLTPSAFQVSSAPPSPCGGSARVRWSETFTRRLNLTFHSATNRIHELTRNLLASSFNLNVVSGTKYVKKA